MAGAWGGPYRSPIQAIHMTHIRHDQTGKMLIWYIGDSHDTSYTTPEAQVRNLLYPSVEGDGHYVLKAKQPQ